MTLLNIQNEQEFECENCHKQIKICSNCKENFYSEETMWCWNNGQHHYCSCDCVFTNEIIKESKSIIKLTNGKSTI